MRPFQTHGADARQGSADCSSGRTVDEVSLPAISRSHAWFIPWTLPCQVPVLRVVRRVRCLYEAHLRWELTQRLGVEWGRVRNGIADIDGIDRPVLREFSTRSREIEAHLDEHGQHSARAAQVAAYATRRAKTSTDPAGCFRHGGNALTRSA